MARPPVIACVRRGPSKSCLLHRSGEKVGHRCDPALRSVCPMPGREWESVAAAYVLARPTLVEAGRRDPSPWRCGRPTPPGHPQRPEPDRRPVGRCLPDPPDRAAKTQRFRRGASPGVLGKCRRVWRVADRPGSHGLASQTHTCPFPFSPRYGT